MSNSCGSHGPAEPYHNHWGEDDDQSHEEPCYSTVDEVLSQSMDACCGSGLSLLAGTTGQAATSISQKGFLQVDQTTVNQILDVFHQGETAIAAGNLDSIMALYASQYNYHGLKQAEIRKIWRDLFEEYRDLSEAHVFSQIVKVGSGSNAIIEVTCTGSLSGLSKTSGLRVPIDNWHEEVHYLTREGGVWRIRGNAGDQPRVLPFGMAPHPLL